MVKTTIHDIVARLKIAIFASAILTVKYEFKY